MEEMFKAKVPYFFFREKDYVHSLTQNCEELYFFFPKTKKKKIQPYFFFPEKVYLHSLNFFGGGHIKNKLKKTVAF